MVAIGATTGPITPTIVITTTDAAGGDGGDVVDPTVCKFFLKSLACMMMTRGGVGRRAKPQGFCRPQFCFKLCTGFSNSHSLAAGLSNWKSIQTMKRPSHQKKCLILCRDDPFHLLVCTSQETNTNLRVQLYM